MHLISTKPVGRMRAAVGQFLRDNGGTSVIEFAFGLPILTLIYFGTVNFCDAITLQRKVTSATRALGDLTTRGQAYTTATITSTVFAGANLIISPYSTTTATMTVTDVCTDAVGNTTTQWAVQSVNGAAPAALTIPAAPANAFTLPAAIKQNNTCLIYSSVSYQYSPILGNSFIQPFTVSDSIYMSPRNIANISFTP